MSNGLLSVFFLHFLFLRSSPTVNLSFAVFNLVLVQNFLLDFVSPLIQPLLFHTSKRLFGLFSISSTNHLSLFGETFVILAFSLWDVRS